MLSSKTTNALIRHFKKTSEEREFISLGKSINADIPTLIFVHPFYFGMKNQEAYYQHPEISCEKQYLENVNQQILESNRKIVLIETRKKSKSTVKYISSRRSLDGMYLVQTGEDNSHPLHLGNDSWRNLARILLDLDSSFEFAGGELHGNIMKVSTLEGCLGGAFRNLSHYGIRGEFLKGCCYQPTSSVGWNF